MNRPNPIILTIIVCALLGAFSTSGALADAYQPELFKSVELIYDESFARDGPHDQADRWVIRQNTQWMVEDGVLVGGTATEEYQKKIQATGDTHDGTRPVIFLRPVPEALVVRMRLRYDGEYAERSYQQLDLGHHVNSFVFGKDRTKLTLKKEKKIFIEGDFFPVNQWAEVAIEIKEGVLMIQIDDRKEIIRDELITLHTDREIQQIDFKGLDHGKVRIDWLKLYRGIE